MGQLDDMSFEERAALSADDEFQIMRNERLREVADREGWSAAEYRAATTGDLYEQVWAEIQASQRASERRRAEDAEETPAPLSGNNGAATTPTTPTTPAPATPPPCLR